MRTERKYRILTWLSLLLAVLLLGNGLREPFRMRAADTRQQEEYVLKGARIYSQQCVQCHGPRGEGSVGMPLNREALRGDEQTAAGRLTYAMLLQAVAQGREGSADISWRRAPDGHWLSYTAMPAWGQEAGGPLNLDELRALALFIMAPSGSQWSLVGDVDLAPLPESNYALDETGQLPLPTAEGVDAATNATAQSLLRNRTRSQCLNCHVIGSRGASVGPDLSRVGSWGLEQQFLADFITYGNRPMPNEADQKVLTHAERMPIYWSQHRAVRGPDLDLTAPVLSEGPYYMLRFRERLTPEEVSVLARYLMGLK